MKQKIISISLALMVSILLSSVCFASSTSYDFNSGSNGRAYLSGRNNGVFYSFIKGNVAKLSLKHTAGTGTLYITLYKDNSWIGLGTSMGQHSWSVTPSANNSFSWNIDETRDDYYLFFQGTGNYVQYKGHGSF